MNKMLRHALKVAASAVELFTKDLRRAEQGRRYDVGVRVLGHRRLSNGRIDHAGPLVEKCMVVVPDGVVIGLSEWMRSADSDPVTALLPRLFDYEAGDRIVLARLDLAGTDSAELPLTRFLSRFLYRRLMRMSEPSEKELEQEGEE